MKNRLFGVLLSLALISGMMSVPGISMNAYAESDPVSYMDWDDAEKELVEKTGEEACREYTVVTGETTEMADGWYVVKESVTIENMVSFSGSVHLILCDGVELKVENGIRDTSGKNETLTVYAQSEGLKTGKLTAFNNNDNTIISGDNITINGGVVTAEGKVHGIMGSNSVTINGGVVTAGGEAYGIYSYHNVTVNGGSVTAYGTADNGAGIGTFINNEGIIYINGGNVTAIGGSMALAPAVINIIDGTGWADKDGSGEKRPIAVNEKGQQLRSYKKVCFPALPAATVKTAPEARTLISGGSAQELVTAGKAEGGEIQYALGTAAEATEAYTAFIPSASEAGTYYVWYKAAGDSNHTDSKPLCVKVTIAEKTEPAPQPSQRPVAVVRGIAKGKASLKLTWNKVDGAAKYEIWMSKCNTADKSYSAKKVKTFDAGKTTFTKKLKKNTGYKFYVAAKDSSGRLICMSLLGHAYTGNVRGKYTNAGSLRVSKASFTMSKGGRAKIKATQTKMKKGKKLNDHEKLLRYTSNDPSVAKVDGKGNITAVSTGKCKVYVQTVNGICKTVDVNVN